MSKYIFLDNWVLSKFNRGDDGRRLASFLAREGYTVIITSLLLTELYNPGWEDAPEKDRNEHVTKLLGAAPCIIVDPVHIFRAEIDAYPYRLRRPPIELDFRSLAAPDRAAELLNFLRRHEDYLGQGKDIAVWSAQYKALKDTWPQQAGAIIEHAYATGSLTRGDDGKLLDPGVSKETFLLSLEFRHALSNEEVNLLLAKMLAERKSGRRSVLCGNRITSLCMWYAYIDFPPGAKSQPRRSDIGDYYHMSLIPYCAVFTIDNAMHKLVQRFQEQYLIRQCTFYNESTLRQRLSVED